MDFVSAMRGSIGSYEGRDTVLGYMLYTHYTTTTRCSRYASLPALHGFNLPRAGILSYVPTECATTH